MLSKYCSNQVYQQMCCKACNEANYTTTNWNYTITTTTITTTTQAPETTPFPTSTSPAYGEDYFDPTEDYYPEIPISSVHRTTVSSTDPSDTEEYTTQSMTTTYEETTFPISADTKWYSEWESTTPESRTTSSAPWSYAPTSWLDVVRSWSPTTGPVPVTVRPRGDSIPLPRTKTTKVRLPVTRSPPTTPVPPKSEDRRDNNSVDVSYKIVDVDNEVSPNVFILRKRPHAFQERTHNKRIQELLAEKRRQDLFKRLRRRPAVQ